MLKNWPRRLDLADSSPTISIANVLLHFSTEMFEDVAYGHRSGLSEPAVGEDLHIEPK
jgi:hypothetical protein